MSDGSWRPCEVCGATDFIALFRKEGHRYVRCQRCGLQRIDPAPTDADLAGIYGRDYYEAWGLSEAGRDVGTLKRATFRRVVAAAGVLPRGAKVLDCGAATGFLMEVAAEQGWEPYGVEISSFGAREIAHRFGRDRVFDGRLDEAQFPALGRAAFSAAFMCDFLEHVRDPSAALRQTAEWLAPGAPLVITTPRLGSVTHRLMGAGWTHYKTEHLYYFTPENLRVLLARAGFEDVEYAPARKTMSIDYVRHQLTVYRHPLLTPLVGLLRWLPRRARRRPIAVVLGEMLVVARRRRPR